MQRRDQWAEDRSSSGGNSPNSARQQKKARVAHSEKPDSSSLQGQKRAGKELPGEDGSDLGAAPLNERPVINCVFVVLLYVCLCVCV